MSHHSRRTASGPLTSVRALLVSGIVTGLVVGLASGALALVSAHAGQASPEIVAAGSPQRNQQVSAPVKARATVDDATGVRGTIFYAGDSLVTKYDDKPDTARQGFWSKLSRELGERSVLDAQGGSGFVKPGVRRAGVKSGSSQIDVSADESRCDGTTYEQRLTSRTARLLTAADVVVVEGGRNDFHTCDQDGRLVPVSTAQLRTAVGDYLDRIAALRHGNDPRTVYVMTPWGAQVDPYDRRRIIPVVKRLTGKHGFTWIDLGGVLDAHRLDENTYDGIHPTASGNAALVAAILQRSDLAQQVLTLRHARR